MENSEYLVYKGLIYYGIKAIRGKSVGCSHGDAIAQANGMAYVEQITAQFEQQILTLNEDLLIVGIRFTDDPKPN